MIAVAITYPVTFCCIFGANVLVLDRLIDFTRPADNNSASLLRYLGRILVGISSVGSTIGVCANIVAAAIFEQSSQDFLKAKTSAAVFRSRQDALGKATNGTKFFFGFLLFEAIVLLLSVGAFTIAGAISARRIYTALQSASSESGSALKASLHPLFPNRREVFDRAFHTSAQRLKMQITATCLIIFFSFLLRAVFSTIMAVAVVGQITNVSCPGFSGRCDECYNVYSHMMIYLLYTPQYFFSSVFISQPLALLVTLWGMTSGHTLAVMRAGQV